MTAESPVLAHIAMAEIHVRDARQSWDPLSLPGCARCSAHLEQAIGEMQAACETATGPIPGDAKIRLGRLRGEVESLSRLVDSATAFNRGLALRSWRGETMASEVQG